MNKVIFVHKQCAETIGPWADWAMVSITDPGMDAMIKKGWHSLLRVGFHDADPQTESDDIGYVFMDEQDALKIVNFVRQVAPEVEGFVIHCNGGISRSSAVAKWVCEQYGLPFGRDYLKFNNHVYQMLVAAAKSSQSI